MLNLLSKLRNLTSTFPRRKLIFLLGGLILLLAVPLTVFVAQQQQQTKQHASFTSPTNSFSSFTKDYQQLIAEKAIDPAQRILEVGLDYDDAKDPKVSFSETRILNGYVPYEFENLSPDAYTLQELDENSRVLHKARFEIPNDIHVDPNPDGTITAPVHTELKQVDFIKTIPYFSAANSIIIQDPQGKIIAVKYLKDTPKIDNNPNFKVINGEDIVQLRKTSLNSNPVMGFPFSDQAFAREETNRKVNIVIIGDNYKNNFDLFHKDVGTRSSYLLTFEPFRTRASQINFNYIDNSEDLMCYVGSYCNVNKVIKTVNNQGVPYDVIMVIVNDRAYGGAMPLLRMAAVGGGNVAGAKEAFVHELGHVFGGLRDEYVIDSSSDRQLDPLPISITYQTLENCYGGTPPSSNWVNLVGKEDYTKGCVYFQLYRSSPSSVMSDTSRKYYNAVSQKIINGIIDQIAGTFTEDWVLPQVQFISPDSNSPLGKESINIKAQATDDRGVAYVQFWADGVFLKTAYVVPYDFVWDASSEKEGPHTLQLKAYDASGNMGQAEREYALDSRKSISDIKITLAGDLKEGMIVDKPIRVDVNVSKQDKNSIGSIKSFVDDKLMENASFDVLKEIYENAGNPQYGFWIDSSKYSNGTHKFYAKVYDDTGGVAVSDTITFNIVNNSVVVSTLSLTPTPASVNKFENDDNLNFNDKISIPTPTSVVSNIQLISDIKITLGGDLKEGMIVGKLTGVYVKVFEAGRNGISRILFFVDDEPAQENIPYANQSQYDFLVDPSKYPTGYHKVYAKVYDDKGGVAVSDTISFNIPHGNSIVPALSPTPIPASSNFHSLGDADGDGKINDADRYVWIKEFSGVLTTKTADFDGNGIIDTDDYNIWRDSMINPNLPH